MQQGPSYPHSRYWLEALRKAEVSTGCGLEPNDIETKKPVFASPPTLEEYKPEAGPDSALAPVTW